MKKKNRIKKLEQEVEYLQDLIRGILKREAEKDNLIIRINDQLQNLRKNERLVDLKTILNQKTKHNQKL